MLHILYLLFIAPLEFLMRLTLEWAFSLTHSWGVALVFLSVLVNTLVLPIYNRAEAWQEEEREQNRSMARHEAMLYECFKGQERVALLSALRRLRGYNWMLTLRSSVGLLLQVPFFIAAFHLLSQYTGLDGESLGPLADLGKPDALLHVGMYSVNVLPLVMTGVNLFSAFFYTRNLTRRDKAQIYGIALVFLVLLYNASSALTLYWTLNNIYSLARNIVEKSWRRRPSWQKIQKNISNYLEVFAGFDGCFRILFPHILYARKVTIYTFSIGVFFWIYTSAAIFNQHYYTVLDTGFRASLWHFAGQCILTSFLASLVVLFFLFGHHYIRFACHRLLLFVGVPILFLFQIRPFYYEIAGNESYFPFTMWDTTGSLFFLFWILGVFCIGKYSKKLTRLFVKLYNVFIVYFNSSYTLTGKTEQLFISSRQYTFTLSVILGVVCGIFFWYFIPFCTYFSNINEFAFNGWELCKQITPCFLLTTFIVPTLFFIAAQFFSSAYTILPCRQKRDIGCKTSTFYVIVLATLYLLWLEGTILSYNLPQLDGKENIFNSKFRMVLDISIWITVIFLAVKFQNIILKNIALSLFFLILLQVSSLFDAFRCREEKIDLRVFKGISGLSIVDKGKFYENIKFSRTNNIFVFLVDSLDTLALEKTLEIYPEIRKVVEGFWCFQENLGAGGLTPQALPQILSGKVYNKEKDGSFARFTQDALIGEQSMASDALHNNRDVFIDASFWYVASNIEPAKKFDNPAVLTLGNTYKILFKFLPYYCKSMISSKINIRNTEGDPQENLDNSNYNYIIGDDNNKRKFNLLISRVDNFTYNNVFQFIWFFGVHSPYTKNDIIETTREFLLDFAHFLEVMKTRDIYDKTTFILMADHGMIDHRTFYPERNGVFPTILFPLLMIKAKDSSEYIVKRSLTSSSFVREILKGFYSYDDTKETLESILDSLPKRRLFYRPGLGTFEARGKFDSLSLHPIYEKNKIRLYDNIIYTFNTGHSRRDFAYHDIEIADEGEQGLDTASFGGFSLRNINLLKVDASFLYGGMPGSRKRITFLISNFLGNGDVKILDKVSGHSTHWKKNGPIDILCTVDHDGYIKLQFTPIITRANIVHYMIIQDEDAPLPKFPDVD